jgi:hypothetical protein
MRVPHMIEFTSDHRYAFVAAPATGQRRGHPGGGSRSRRRDPDRARGRTMRRCRRTTGRSWSPSSARRTRRGTASSWRSTSIWRVSGSRSGASWCSRTIRCSRPGVASSARRAAPCASRTRRTAGAAYVTLGPGLDEGGVVVVDPAEFRLVEVFPPGTVTRTAARCCLRRASTCTWWAATGMSASGTRWTRGRTSRCTGRRRTDTTPTARG